MITYRATLDVPRDSAVQVSLWLQAHRRRVDSRPWQRAATCWTQAVMVLRWFKDATKVHLLARDAGLSQATAYRYLHEAIDVIAAHAPDLHQVLADGHRQGWSFVSLDGTLIESESTQCAARSENGHDLWYSGKHHRHGGNIQVLTDPSGHPVWTSPVEPATCATTFDPAPTGSVHDITAARAHALPALYPAAAGGLPTLTDKGYTGAGIGIHVPRKGNNLDASTRSRNLAISALRAPAERANALLKSTWKALRRITLCPRRIGHVVAAAHVSSSPVADPLPVTPGRRQGDDRSAPQSVSRPAQRRTR